MPIFVSSNFILALNYPCFVFFGSQLICDSYDRLLIANALIVYAKSDTAHVIGEISHPILKVD